MQSRHSFAVPFFLLSALIACSAEPIVIREAANCSGSDARNTASVPLHEGDAIREKMTLSAGTGGRMQLDYGSGLVRAGASSSLHLEENGRIELRDGAFLFQNISKKQYLAVPAAQREIRISGDTGFVRVQHGRDAKESVVAIGALSGRVDIDNGTKTFKLGPADLLVVPAAGTVFREHFDLQKQMSSSRLLNGFSSKLRDPTTLASAEHNFVGLRQRGFFRARDSFLEQPNAQFVAGSPLLGDTRERRVASQPISGASGQAAASGVSFAASEGISILTGSDLTPEVRPPTYSVGFGYSIPGHQVQPHLPPIPPQHPPHQPPPGGGH